MRRVHLVRAALTAALLSVAALAAAPAAAGGPTSALLSIPGAGSTASLYYTDPEYDELAGLVGVNEPSGTFDGKESGGHEFGPGITVTWLVHDVEPWRVDRIYLGGKDGPWISTQVSDFGGASIWESPVLWHRPAAGARLTNLLDGLGLGTAASKNTDFEGVAGASEQKTTRGGAAGRRARGGGRRHRDGVARPRRLGARRAGRGRPADARLDQAPRRRARRHGPAARRVRGGAGPLTRRHAAVDG